MPRFGRFHVKFMVNNLCFPFLWFCIEDRQDLWSALGTQPSSFHSCHFICFCAYVPKYIVRTQSYTAEVSRNFVMHFKVMEIAALFFTNCLTVKCMESVCSKFTWDIVFLHEWFNVKVVDFFFSLGNLVKSVMFLCWYQWQSFVRGFIHWGFVSWVCKRYSIVFYPWKYIIQITVLYVYAVWMKLLICQFWSNNTPVCDLHTLFLPYMFLNLWRVEYFISVALKCHVQKIWQVFRVVKSFIEI